MTVSTPGLGCPSGYIFSVPSWFVSSASGSHLPALLMRGQGLPREANSASRQLLLCSQSSNPVTSPWSKRKLYQLNIKKDPDRGDKTDEELEKGALRQKKYFRNTSVVAVCNEVEWERSVWLSIENMSLAAVAEGLGSCIVLLWGEEKAMAEELLGLPGNYELTALLKIGVPGEKGLAPDKNPWAPRRPEFSWLHKNRFGNRD